MPAADCAACYSYTSNGDGTVTDNVSRLMWQQMPLSGTYSEPNAVVACQASRVGNYDDWRLPSLSELESLADFCVSPAGAINPTYFPWTSAQLNAPVWSTTSQEGQWFVGMNVGGADSTPPTNALAALCVR